MNIEERVSFTSLNPTILIIPDVHEQIQKLKAILRTYASVPDVIFLGNFFDTFDGLTEATHETARWFADNSQNPQYRFLWGNHDLHYPYPLLQLICSGFTHRKLSVIRTYVPQEHWDQFRLHTWAADRWLCTHAGWHPHHLHPVKGFERDTLLDLERRALDAIKTQQKVTALVAAGRSRGGSAVYGGVDWLDWDEFKPIPGLNQIVGHTPDSDIRTKHLADSENYCLDTNLNHVILIEDGKVRVEAV